MLSVDEIPINVVADIKTLEHSSRHLNITHGKFCRHPDSICILIPLKSLMMDTKEIRSIAKAIEKAAQAKEPPSVFIDLFTKLKDEVKPTEELLRVR